ncbi:Lnb N-terminal periplasmic domain-containing protein [Stutzerimonas tarimensis]|uniref:DUF4105 domain-containing protein n=1 Tax=Stutzerimonas tarimensis TaxID=1507735 RepID=A0ABV7T8E1_9GAMM
MTVSRILPRLAKVLVSLAGLLFTTWGALALHYRLAWPAPLVHVAVALWCLLGLALLVLLWRRAAGSALAGFLVGFGVLLLWWQGLEPAAELDWAPEVAEMASGSLEGNQLLMRNVRNFDWRSEDDFTEAWETRRYDLDRLVSVDLFTSYRGLPAIAHVILSFGFDNGRFLAFSVEARREYGEAWSEIGGFFKEYELSIIATDERDAIRLRTNVRGEQVYLYRLNMGHTTLRALLLSYMEQANALQDRPRFYNTLTANYTTLVFDMAQRLIGGLPLDPRLGLSGYLPGYLERLGALTSGYSLEELRTLGHVNVRAWQAGHDEAFSLRIRQGVPAP